MEKLKEENERLLDKNIKLAMRIDRRKRIATEMLKLQKENKKLDEENRLLKKQLELSKLDEENRLLKKQLVQKS